MAGEKPISGAIDLLKIRGSRIATIDNTDGIFIPFRLNGVVYLKTEKKESAFLNWFGLPKKDNYGNDFMVARNRTADEVRDGTYSEILGNAKVLGGEKPKYWTGGRKKHEEDSESPF